MRIRRLIAALTLASAATTGLALTTTPAAAAEIDTSITTPATTTGDTYWGIAPAAGTTVTTQDTYWG